MSDLARKMNNGEMIIVLLFLIGCSTQGPIPKRLTITGPQTLTYGVCSPSNYTVTAEEDGGSQVLLASSIRLILAVYNTGGPLGGEFFLDSACTQQVATVSIPRGAASTTYYFKGYADSELTMQLDDGPGAMTHAILPIQISRP